VRDEIGRKISKTTGNVIDPLVLMDEFGTDALRFTMLVGSTPGNDTNVGPKKVEANRNFANKLWNAGRFVINAIDALDDGPSTTDQDGPSARVNGQNYTLADSWIWAKLQQLVRDVERLFENFQYGEAGRQIYEFIWSDFADWYVEIAKEQLKNNATKARTAETLARILDISLRLLHPFTPFVTEEIWGHLRDALRESSLKQIAEDWPEALIVASWPEPRQPKGWEESRTADFTLIQEIVRSIRNLRAEKNVAPSKRIAATIAAGPNLGLVQEQSRVIAQLAGLNEAEMSIHDALAEKPGDAAALVVGAVEIYLPLAGMLDLAGERTRLEKELKEARSHAERLEKLLASDFAAKAPPALVQKEREKLEGHRKTAEKIEAQLK
ncbi:MAG: class I tRNA ligase family protein, partial [Bacteroidota bacterium]